MKFMDGRKRLLTLVLSMILFSAPSFFLLEAQAQQRPAVAVQHPLFAGDGRIEGTFDGLTYTNRPELPLVVLYVNGVERGRGEVNFDGAINNVGFDIALRNSRNNPLRAGDLVRMEVVRAYNRQTGRPINQPLPSALETVVERPTGGNLQQFAAQEQQRRQRRLGDRLREGLANASQAFRNINWLSPSRFSRPVLSPVIVGDTRVAGTYVVPEGYEFNYIELFSEPDSWLNQSDPSEQERPDGIFNIPHPPLANFQEGVRIFVRLHLQAVGGGGLESVDSEHVAIRPANQFVAPAQVPAPQLQTPLLAFARVIYGSYDPSLFRHQVETVATVGNEEIGRFAAGNGTMRILLRENRSLIAGERVRLTISGKRFDTPDAQVFSSFVEEVVQPAPPLQVGVQGDLYSGDTVIHGNFARGLPLYQNVSLRVLNDVNQEIGTLPAPARSPFEIRLNRELRDDERVKISITGQRDHESAPQTNETGLIEVLTLPEIDPPEIVDPRAGDPVVLVRTRPEYISPFYTLLLGGQMVGDRRFGGDRDGESTLELPEGRVLRANESVQVILEARVSQDIPRSSTRRSAVVPVNPEARAYPPAQITGDIYEGDRWFQGIYVHQSGQRMHLKVLVNGISPNVQSGSGIAQPVAGGAFRYDFRRGFDVVPGDRVQPNLLTGWPGQENLREIVAIPVQVLPLPEIGAPEVEELSAGARVVRARINSVYLRNELSVFIQRAEGPAENGVSGFIVLEGPQNGIFEIPLNEQVAPLRAGDQVTVRLRGDMTKGGPARAAMSAPVVVSAEILPLGAPTIQGTVRTDSQVIRGIYPPQAGLTVNLELYRIVRGNPQLIGAEEGQQDGEFAIPLDAGVTLVAGQEIFVRMIDANDPQRTSETPRPYPQVQPALAGLPVPTIQQPVYSDHREVRGGNCLAAAAMTVHVEGQEGSIGEGVCQQNESFVIALNVPLQEGQMIYVVMRPQNDPDNRTTESAHVRVEAALPDLDPADIGIDPVRAGDRAVQGRYDDEGYPAGAIFDFRLNIVQDGAPVANQGTATGESERFSVPVDAGTNLCGGDQVSVTMRARVNAQDEGREVTSPSQPVEVQGQVPVPVISGPIYDQIYISGTYPTACEIYDAEVILQVNGSPVPGLGAQPVQGGSFRINLPAGYILEEGQQVQVRLRARPAPGGDFQEVVNEGNVRVQSLAPLNEAPIFRRVPRDGDQDVRGNYNSGYAEATITIVVDGQEVVINQAVDSEFLIALPQALRQGQNIQLKLRATTHPRREIFQRAESQIQQVQPAAEAMRVSPVRRMGPALPQEDSPFPEEAYEPVEPQRYQLPEEAMGRIEPAEEEDETPSSDRRDFRMERPGYDLPTPTIPPIPLQIDEQETEKKSAEEMKKKEEDSRQMEIEKQRKAKEDAKQQAEEKEKEEELQKKRAEEEAREKAEEELKAKQQAEEEARKQTEIESKRKAEEEAKEAQLKAEEARKQAELDAQRKAEEEAKRKVEEEAKRKAAEESRKKSEFEAQKKFEETQKVQIEKTKKEQDIDLAVINLSYDPQTNTGKAVVENKGQNDVQNVKLNFWMKDEFILLKMTLDGSEVIKEIKAGSKQAYEYRYKTMPGLAGVVECMVEIDAKDKDPSNNKATVTVKPSF